MKQLELSAKAILILLTGIVITGCATAPGGIAASTTPIGNREYRTLGRAAKTDSLIYLLGFLPISGRNTTREAVEACVDSRGGDAMINVTVDAYSQYWILFTKYTTRVEGEVIRFK